MLYPDLGRLSLAQGCATGGTHDHEAGGSNDPHAVFGDADMLRKILLESLPDGEAELACRAAARWCHLNKFHQKVCDDGTWRQLTRAVFPNARAPIESNNGGRDEPTAAKEWFFYLCTQRKKLRELYEELEDKTVSKRISAKKNAQGEDVQNWLRKNAARVEADRRYVLMDRLLRTEEARQPPAVVQEIRASAKRFEREARRANKEFEREYGNGSYSDPYYMWRHIPHINEWQRMLHVIVEQEAYVRDLEPDPTLSSEEHEVDRLFLLMLGNIVRDDAERARQERESKERRARKEQEYQRWLAALEEQDPREKDLSKLLQEARERLKKVRGRGADGLRFKMLDIEKQRRKGITYANNERLVKSWVKELRKEYQDAKHYTLYSY